MDAQNQPTARLRRAPGALLALLMAMTAIGPLSLNILIPALPAVARELAAAPDVVQLAVSLYLLGLAVSQLVFGPLSDRFGRRPIVLTGLFLTALASAAGLAVYSIAGLIAARVVQSFSASGGIVVGRAIIRDVYDRERAASMIGWVTTAMVVAPMIAPLLGGLIESAFGWKATFLFVALFSFAVFVWALLTLPETRPHHIETGGLRQFIADLRALFANRIFNGYVLTATFGSATFFTFLGGGPLIVISMMGRSSTEYGTWFVLTAFGYMLGNVVAARVSPRYGINRMVRAGVSLQVIGALLSVASSLTMPAGGPEIVFLPQFLISFGNGVFLPNAISGAISVRPNAAGTASGIIGSTQFAAGALAAQMVGHLLERATTPLPLAITLVLLAALALASFTLLIRRRD